MYVVIQLQIFLTNPSHDSNNIMFLKLWEFYNTFPLCFTSHQNTALYLCEKKILLLFQTLKRIMR